MFTSREAARTAIMDGAILVNKEKQTKPGMPVSIEAKVELIESYARNKFASRGGLKLETALNQFEINPAGRTCLDIGASTGGFTDCLLQNGAVKVYAVDVGYGQLLWQLRNDPRVVSMERFNARNLTPDFLYKNDQNNECSTDSGGSFKDDSGWASLAVIDVSFIALEKVLAPTFACLQKRSAEAICLVKPQFEIGKDKVGKGGVVRAKEDHSDVLHHVKRKSAELNLVVSALTFSPIKGPAGNIEFLMHLSRKSDSDAVNFEEGNNMTVMEAEYTFLNKDKEIDIEKVVLDAHKALNQST